MCRQFLFSLLMVGLFLVGSSLVQAQEYAPPWHQSRSHILCEHAKVNTEDATPVDPGSFELELGYGLVYAKDFFNDKWEKRSRGTLREHSLGLAFTMGIVEGLDLGVEKGYVELRDDEEDARKGQGLSDMGVGFKWRFYAEEEDDLGIAWVGGVVAPSGRSEAKDRLGITQDFWSTDQALVMTQDFDETTINMAVTASLPLERVKGYDGTLAADLAMGYHVAQGLQPELEINYAHDFQAGTDADSVGITAGLIVCLPAGFRVNTGIQQIVAGRNVDKATSFIFALVYSH